MLNIALTSPYPRLDDLLQNEPSFHDSLTELIENQSIVIRGKTIMTYLLLFKMNPIWLVNSIELKFF